MDSRLSTVSTILVIVTVIIYDVFCTDASIYGRNNNSSPVESQNKAWSNFNSSIFHTPLNGPPQDGSFNLSHAAWPPLRTPHSSSRSRNRHRGSHRNRTVTNTPNSHSLDSTRSNNTFDAKADVSDNELRAFSEELLKRDVNNVAKYVTADFQGKTTSSSMDDKAPLSLLTVPNHIHQIPTFAKLKRLHDNYIVFVNQTEVVTSEENKEEDDFLNAILDTEIMQYTRNFLVEKGKISNNPTEFKNILKEVWFYLYSRSKGHLGSSGFEHSFLGEIKQREVSGFHNWVYFNDQELQNNVNYLGYLKILTLGNMGHILKLHFVFHGADKPVATIMIGTSPELEMALYSTCFILRADRVCPVQLSGKKFVIRTYTFNYDGKKLIGSAFPEI